MLKGTHLAALNLTQQLHALNQNIVSDMPTHRTNRIDHPSKSRAEKDQGDGQGNGDDADEPGTHTKRKS